jgi:hypothetical protein
MLAEIANTVWSDLRHYPNLVAYLSRNHLGVRPLVAEKIDGSKFVTYEIKFIAAETKGGVRQFRVTVNSWAPSYTLSVTIADQVEAAFGASSNFYSYESAESFFTEQEQIYTQQIFNIKK